MTPLATFVKYYSETQTARAGFVKIQMERNGELTFIGNSHTDLLISSRRVMRHLIKSRLIELIKDRRQNH